MIRVRVEDILLRANPVSCLIVLQDTLAFFDAKATISRGNLRLDVKRSRWPFDISGDYKFTQRLDLGAVYKFISKENPSLQLILHFGLDKARFSIHDGPHTVVLGYIME